MIEDRISIWNIERKLEIFGNLIEKTIAFLHFGQMDEKTRAN